MKRNQTASYAGRRASGERNRDQVRKEMSAPIHSLQDAFKGLGPVGDLVDHDPAALEHLGGSGSRHLNAQANLSYAQVPRATVWWHHRFKLCPGPPCNCVVAPLRSSRKTRGGSVFLEALGRTVGRYPGYTNSQPSQETDGRTISKYPLKHGCHWLMQSVFSRCEPRRASTASDSPAQPAAADGRGCHHSSPESRFLRRTGCSP